MKLKRHINFLNESQGGAEKFLLKFMTNENKSLEESYRENYYKFREYITKEMSGVNLSGYGFYFDNPSSQWSFYNEDNGNEIFVDVDFDDSEILIIDTEGENPFNAKDSFITRENLVPENFEKLKEKLIQNFNFYIGNTKTVKSINKYKL